MRASPRRGAALFIVLLFSAFLSALAAAAMRTSLSGVRAASAFADSQRADELGRDAASALIFRLVTGDDAARRGGSIGVRLPGADVTIDYRSESARVDANAAAPGLIAALLAATGTDPADAEAAAARIARFRAEAAAHAQAAARAPEAGGTADTPPAGGLAALRAAIDALGPAHPQHPAAAETPAIHDTADVAQDWGLSDEAARRVQPFLTVSNGAATVDPVLAERPVLLALLGGDERADDYIERRRRGFTGADAAMELIPVAARDEVGFKDVPAVRALVRVRLMDRFERRFDMVLAPARPSPERAGAPGSGSTSDQGAPAGRDPPPVLVSWHELP